ncbi:hypothetical protein [Chitinophaga sp.]|uniref:hypothetical protein n=1 Tax=Chitinophaga sp. TaxID=1869181 RepID=UPI002C899C3E|nr:hypothetical protein [Chitinophaga sp.]HWV66583.1 hypothetical protein [Chitinophaga sp.]
MQKRWWIGILCLFPGMMAGAQTTMVKPLSLTAVKPLSFVLTDTFAFRPAGFLLKPVTLLPRTFPVREPVTAPVYRVAPDAYYQQHFGFFCKKEWTWQKQTGLPLKFRLGSYSYAQQQEGKR